MGSFREVDAEGGDGSSSIDKFLLQCGRSSADIWVRDLGAVGCNGEKTRGHTSGFHMAGDRKEGKKAKRWFWEENGAPKRATAGGDTTAWRQAAVTEWMDLRSILKVCTKETGYQGRGRDRELWWRQTAANKQLRATLEDILAAARERQIQEPGRHDRGKGGEEEIYFESNG